MKKTISTLAVVLLIIFTASTPVFAIDNGLSIELISPSGASTRPVYDDIVVSKVSNNTGATMNDLIVYVTIIDTTNNIAVAVDEYGSTVDKPRKIESLLPEETIDIEIPIRFMYVGEFELYTSIMHKESNTVISSSPITIDMIGDSNINTNLVIIVSIAVPIFLLVIVLWLNGKQKKRQRG